VASRTGHKDQSALKAALDAWFDEARRARWKNSADVKRHYATASVISADRIVFNIKGNSYRLVVSVDFEKASPGSSGSAHTEIMTVSTYGGS